MISEIGPKNATNSSILLMQNSTSSIVQNSSIAYFDTLLYRNWLDLSKLSLFDDAKFKLCAVL